MQSELSPIDRMADAFGDRGLRRCGCFDRGRLPLLRAGEDRVDQSGVPLPGLAGGVHDARHLDAEREVLPEALANARRHRDAARGRFEIQGPMVARVDPAVDQSS